MTIKTMPVAEFRKLGLLQELNRLFLHPRGLALEVLINEETGEESFGGVWDYRDDPEGMLYADDVLSAEKEGYVRELLTDKAKVRVERYGWVTQPLPESAYRHNPWLD